MLHTSAVTIAGEELVLIIAEPNHAAAVELTARLPVAEDESVTGVPERRPDADWPLWSLSYETYLSGTDLQALRAVVGGLEGQRVAIPVWPDVSEDTAGPARIFCACPLTVGWELSSSGDPTSVTVSSSGTFPARTYAAGLMVGRLTIDAGALHDTAATVRIRLREEAPRAWRLPPPGDAAEEWEWEINWADEPSQAQRDLQEYDSIGRSGLDALAGEPLRLWTQRAGLTLSRPELTRLIGFWAARRAGHEAFTLPSALQPGAATAAAPHTFGIASGRARFAGGELRIRFADDPVTADVGLNFEQQIEVGSHEESPPPVAFLYTLTYLGESLRLTDWSAPVASQTVTYAFAGGVPAGITADGAVTASAPSSYSGRDNVLRFVCAGSGGSGRLYMGGLTPGVSYQYSMRIAVETAPYELLLPNGDFYGPDPGWGLFTGSATADASGRISIYVENDFASASIYLDEISATAGESYTPARIQHGRIRQSLKPQNEECELTVYLDDAPIVAPLLRVEAEEPLAVQIHQKVLPSGTPQLLFSGTAARARGRGRQITLGISAFGGALRRQIPRFQHSNRCNHTLFSPGCMRRRPTEMAPATWQSTGTYAAHDTDTLWLTLTAAVFPASIPAAPAPGNGFFTGGWVETGTGSARQLREVLDSWYNSDNGDFLLRLARPLNTDLISTSQEVRFWPGCDGQIATCASRFTNSIAFGGFPHTPTWIEQAPVGGFKPGK